MRARSLLILCIFCNFILKSQNEVSFQYMDSLIEKVIKFTEINQSNKTLMTYSIQITASENPQTIKNIKNQYFPLNMEITYIVRIYIYMFLLWPTYLGQCLLKKPG